MQIELLKPGDLVTTVDGAVAEVLKESQDHRWILVRYVSAPGHENWRARTTSVLRTNSLTSSHPAPADRAPWLAASLWPLLWQRFHKTGAAFSPAAPTRFSTLVREVPCQ